EALRSVAARREAVHGEAGSAVAAWAAAAVRGGPPAAAGPRRAHRPAGWIRCAGSGPSPAWPRGVGSLRVGAVAPRGWGWAARRFRHAGSAALAGAWNAGSAGGWPA